LHRKTPLRAKRYPEKKPRPRGRRRFPRKVEKVPRVCIGDRQFEGELEDAKGRPWLRVMRDGRHVLNQRTHAGWLEYRARVERMWMRQEGICCLYGIAPDCPGALTISEATFEHEHCRGAGGAWRDDRTEINGRWLNGAAHYGCNSWKGSRHITYNEQIQERSKR
jgi:hypothetical protein